MKPAAKLASTNDIDVQAEVAALSELVDQLLPKLLAVDIRLHALKEQQAGNRVKTRSLLRLLMREERP